MVPSLRPGSESPVRHCQVITVSVHPHNTQVLLLWSEQCAKPIMSAVTQYFPVEGIYSYSPDQGGLTREPAEGGFD